MVIRHKKVSSTEKYNSALSCGSFGFEMIGAN